ncbi:MAG TPA: SGNH/GDSL hydrolase family protein [Verrucomicrobiales bacterium]|nr:SGNH/GDSL hydrolase family protein [Verrucomicrobiales bacterium]
MNLTRRHTLAALLAAPLAGIGGGRAAESGELLTREQETRLKKYLPRTFPKLKKRDPVFVAVCGDEISAFYEPGVAPSRGAHVMAWHGRFLDRLGASFFYHGGVMDLAPVPEGAAPEMKKKWEEYRRLREEWEKAKKGDPPKLPGLPAEEPGAPSRELSANDILRLTRVPGEQFFNRSTFFADNYCESGAVGVQVFDPLLSSVFRTEETDLVIIAYGARDALEAASLATFRTALETAVAECRKKGADVILAGPPPALDEADERAAIGRSRPWAAVMREVADAAGIFFADLGAAAVYQPSDLLNRTVASTFRASSEPVRRMFDHGPKFKDGLHPNAAAHRRMGETTADWLMNGEPARPFEISGEFHAGRSDYGDDALIIRVARRADVPLTIALCPLRFNGWSVKPGSPDRLHTFQQGRGARLFRFEMVPNTEPLQGHEEFIRGSAIVSDDEAQHLVDVKVKILPLAMLWPEQRIDGASGDCLLKCTMVNTGKEDLDLSLTLEVAGKQSVLPGVKVESGERQAVPVRVPLPPADGAFRFKHIITIIAAAGSQRWKFTRRIEGVRHAGLQQKLPLVPLARWRGDVSSENAASTGASLSIQAHTTGIFFLIDVPAENSSAIIEGKPWGRLEVQMDGRPAGENGTLGCVGRVVVEIPHENGRGRVLPVRPFAFGRFYPFPYDPNGFICPVTTLPDGGRRIEFNMTRKFLPAHGWSLDGSGQNDLGINLRLFLCDPNTGGYSEAKTFVLTASSFPSADARSLTVLELRDKPAARWSLRIG